jgi:hypothetical protein
VLSISARLVTRNLDNIEPGFPTTGGLAEDVIDFLQRAVGSLRVKEVDDWEDEGVYDGEDHVGFIANGGERDWGYHYDHEVECPLFYGISFCTENPRIGLNSGLLTFADVERPFDGARILRGTISAGYSHVIPSQPMAKKVLKTNRNTAEMIPGAEPPRLTSDM